MYYLVSTLAPSFLIGSSLFWQGRRTTIKSRTSSTLTPIRPRTAELVVLEHLKKNPIDFNGENLVSTLEPSFSIGSSSFSQVMRTTIKALMSSNFSRIPPLTSELAALDRLEKKNDI